MHFWPKPASSANSSQTACRARQKGITMRIRTIIALVSASLLSITSSPLRAQDTILTGPAAYGDWTKDAPGVWRRITAADLPQPSDKPAQSISTLVPEPAGVLPRVLPGFTISVVATGLSRPRVMKLAP